MLSALVEAMTGSLPLACPNRGPVPDILQNDGTDFDPESPQSIAEAVAKLLSEHNGGNVAAASAKILASYNSWSRWAADTRRLLADVSAAHSAMTTWAE
jgi:glycosyltransferase involved in cell wall biosynthesis